MIDITDYLRTLSGIEPKTIAPTKRTKPCNPRGFLALKETTEECLAQVTHPAIPLQRRQRFYDSLAGTYFRRCSSLGIDYLTAFESLEVISASTGTLDYCDEYRITRARESRKLKILRN